MAELTIDVTESHLERHEELLEELGAEYEAGISSRIEEVIDATYRENTVR